jgi:sugar lactone lactonase YvrE
MKRFYILAFLFSPSFVGAQDMPLSQVLLPNEGWHLVAHEFKSISGLTANKHGKVFVSDPESKQIIRIGKDGRGEVFATPTAAVQQLAIDAEGHLYGYQPGRQRIVLLAGGDKETVRAENIGGLGDFIVARSGACYWTVPDAHTVLRINTDGLKQLLDQSIAKPTGLTLWPDQGTLVVADAGGAHLWAFRVENNGGLKAKDGGLNARECYYPLRVRPGETSGAAGMTMDSAGRLYVATREGVQVFDPTGRLSGVLAKPDAGELIGVAFGGEDLQTLFVATGSKLYARMVLARGALAEPGKFTCEFQKAEDSFKTAGSRDAQVFEITSKSGIGKALVTRTEGTWPSPLVVRFVGMKMLEHISVLDGTVGLNGAIGQENRKTIRYDRNGKETKEAKEAVFTLTIVRTANGMEVTIPTPFGTAKMKQLHLAWIDAYRN